MALKLRATRPPAQGKWTNVPCPQGHDITASFRTRAPVSFKCLLGGTCKEIISILTDRQNNQVWHSPRSLRSCEPLGQGLHVRVAVVLCVSEGQKLVDLEPVDQDERVVHLVVLAIEMPNRRLRFL